jgi:hypothetical protein
MLFMGGMTDAEKQLRASVAVNRLWANTIDRSARTAPARKASPVDLEWHAARLDPPPQSEQERLQRAESARRAYLKSLSLKAATAARKRREAKQRESEALIRDD